jgi:hypothetical protein
MPDSIINYGFDSMIEGPPLTDGKPEATAADTGETPATTEAAPAASAYLDDYESPEDVRDVLRAELGEEKFTEMYDGASQFAQEFAKYNPEGFEILASRLGNHPEIIKSLYTLKCMMDGCRPQKPAAVPSTAAVDAELKKFEKGGEHFEQWLGGSKSLNDLRIRLYSQRYKGRVQL